MLTGNANGKCFRVVCNDDALLARDIVSDASCCCIEKKIFMNLAVSQGPVEYTIRATSF